MKRFLGRSPDWCGGRYTAGDARYYGYCSDQAQCGLVNFSNEKLVGEAAGFEMIAAVVWISLDRCAAVSGVTINDSK